MEPAGVRDAITAAASSSTPEASDSCRVTWQWVGGGGGHVDCTSPESAQLVVADLRPDSRVWIGQVLVHDGWPKA
jgi:hypothetical protein